MQAIRVLTFVALIAAGGGAWLSAASAQEGCTAQTIKIIIPSAPGSTTDQLARITADATSRKWGKSVVVENIAGGSMNIGATQASRAAPDGCTLFLAPPAPLTISNLLSKDLNYSPSDFVPITMLAKIANVLTVRKDLPAASLKELIAYAKAHPGKLTYATQGVGSTAHLSGAQLEALAGIKMVAVPYRGAQPALTDILAGNVDMFFDTLATSVPLLRGGKVRILAVADLTRARAAPELPTFSEAGLPGFRSITWFAMVAPPGMAKALAQKINADVVDVLHRPEVGDKLHALSLDVGATTPAETTKFFADETALWSKVIKEANIQPH